jgi:hypothetical protein
LFLVHPNADCCDAPSVKRKYYPIHTKPL